MSHVVIGLSELVIAGLPKKKPEDLHLEDDRR
jgi:hypothetical protein